MDKKEILFPFPDFRSIQKEMIKEVCDQLENNHDLIMHAPTGLGKTAVLGPVIAYAKQHKKKVFFLTPRHAQHKVAVDLIKMIKDVYGERVYTVDFLGKKHMCSLIKPEDTMTSGAFYNLCRHQRQQNMCDYYTNFSSSRKSFERKALFKDLRFKSPQHAEDMKLLSTQAGFCPYEVAAQMGKKAQVIIGDYYYLFAESVRDSLFNRLQINIEDCIIIVDEAHNLTDRVKKFLTFTLSTGTLDAAMSQDQKYGLGLKDLLATMKTKLLALKQHLSFGEQEQRITRDLFMVDDSVIDELELAAEAIVDQEQQNHFLSISHFLEGWTDDDEVGFLRVVQLEESRQGDPIIRISKRCIDASKVVSPLAKDVHGFILMSGTLTPISVYQKMLGLDHAQAIEFENPFPKENELNIIYPRTTTRFEQRSEAMFEDIAIVCANVVDAVPGNCAIFFPSYALMAEIKQRFETKCKKTVMAEVRDMSKEEKAAFLEKFKRYKDRGAVLLGVAAGSFGEGIDLFGDFLKAVVVVGMPFTRPDLETQEMIEYFNRKFTGNGWEYAYLFPMITKTLQNAGRCIRSETDKGVIVYLDERYSWPRYRKYFPRDKQIKVSLNPVKEIQEFFAGKKS